MDERPGALPQKADAHALEPGEAIPSSARGREMRKEIEDMAKSDSQRLKLSRFVDLARMYRGWSRTELSRVLGRDPSKIVPESGNPKLDLLVGLADALDWNVGDVAESVWSDRDASARIETCPFRELGLESLKAHEAGRYEEMLELARRMRLVAETSDGH